MPLSGALSAGALALLITSWVEGCRRTAGTPLLRLMLRRLWRIFLQECRVLLPAILCPSFLGRERLSETAECRRLSILFAIEKRTISDRHSRETLALPQCTTS